VKNPVPLRSHVKHMAKGILFGAMIVTILIGIPLVAFAVIWGWHRFLLDFWPLDNSRVGPNLAASVVVVILVTGHNEYRTAVKDMEKGETVEGSVREMEQEVLHPVEAGEESVAEDVAEKS
jgi:hypothetical protein